MQRQPTDSPPAAPRSPSAEPSEEEVPRDQIFAQPRRAVDFHFGQETASVFDDMLDRSVPFYSEIERMIGELAVDHAEDDTTIWDLGCSTAATFLEIGRRLPQERNVRFVGIDNSAPMLDIARRKLEAEPGFRWPYELRNQDLHQGVVVDNASVTMLVLTLQFLRPMHRNRLIRAIQRGTTETGCLILVEKVLSDHSTFNRLFIEHYYEYKRRNGYSDLEIAQKREALENVLVPYRVDENVALLHECGFAHVEVFFKWYNFCGMIAAK